VGLSCQPEAVRYPMSVGGVELLSILQFEVYILNKSLFAECVNIILPFAEHMVCMASFSIFLLYMALICFKCVTSIYGRHWVNYYALYACSQCIT